MSFGLYDGQPKMLLVDDQNGIRVLLQEVFKCNEFHVITARSGKEAIHLFKEHLPHIVVMDLIMPQMNGDEVLDAIKKINPDAKVIIMTAYDKPDLIKRCHELGAVHSFRKPFDIDELVEKVLQSITFTHEPPEWREVSFDEAETKYSEGHHIKSLVTGMIYDMTQNESELKLTLSEYRGRWEFLPKNGRRKIIE